MQYVVGIDEVGRGPLAGPVSVGIAVVPVSFDFSVFKKLTDSKKMTARAREAAAEYAETLKGEGILTFGDFSSSSSAIDQEGIEHCIASSISRGLAELSVSSDDSKIFLDGRLKAPKEFEQETVIRGDLLIPVISLASVVAKVHRDKYMVDVLHPEFPEYQFDSHKGYGTAAHIGAIKEYGPSLEHRISFLSRILPVTLQPSTI